MSDMVSRTLLGSSGIQQRLDQAIRDTVPGGRVKFGVAPEQEEIAREIFEADDRVRIFSVEKFEDPCPYWMKIRFKLELTNASN